jgi:hypothetical protein
MLSCSLKQTYNYSDNALAAIKIMVVKGISRGRAPVRDGKPRLRAFLGDAAF